MKIKILIVYTLFLTAFFITNGHAQDTAPQEGETAHAGTASIMNGEDIEKLAIKKEPKVIKDGYIEPTFENLANMYWGVGKFDMDDNKAIDYYMMITNCPIYKQYFNNEFEWEKIRTAARQYIDANRSKLPTRFEAILPLVLNDYDVKMQQFSIDKAYQQHNIMRIDILSNLEGKNTCDFKGRIPLYPKNIIVVLNRPFSLRSFPVNPEIAQIYMEEQGRIMTKKMENTFAKKTVKLHSEHVRPAYLRLKLKLSQYKETISDQNMYRAVIYAAVEGWDVYADESETKPLYTGMIKAKNEPLIPEYMPLKKEDSKEYKVKPF